MKLKKLNKALVAAGLVAGAAISMPSQAVVMSDDGTGEVLIYPFYTVQGPENAPRATIFTITNTTNAYKAVKVRFHEAHNSRDARDFNLYLSPNDVWTASVSRDVSGVARFQTTDNSCTLPTSIMRPGAVESLFVTAAYDQNSNNDGGNQNAIRTNEGYLEVIEMGEIDPSQNIVVSGAGAGQSPLGGNSSINTLGEAILHTGGYPGGGMIDGIPTGCRALESAIGTNGVWRVPLNSGSLNNAHVGVSQPTGGLSGSGYITQPSLGTVAAYNATALKHFYDVASRAQCNGADTVGDTYCETFGQANAAETTNRAYDDLHSFKDLDSTTANSRSIQTYPNLAMAFPQISTVFDADGGVTGVGSTTTLEWSGNQSVSTGVTTSRANTLFASIRDLNTNLSNDASPAVSVSTQCGGTDGVSSSAQAGDCANARPVSAVLARMNLTNEYVLEQDASSGVDFKTDIVVTFPTKWYFTDNGLYSNGTVVDGTNTQVSSLENINLPPFSSQFVSSDASGNRDQACERFSIDQGDILPGGTSGSIFDREESVPNVSAGVLVPSPAININIPQQVICQEANVLTINNGDLLSSRIANGLNTSVDNSASGDNSFNIDFSNAGSEFDSGQFTLAFDTASAHQMTSVANGPMAAGAVNYGIPGARTVAGLPAVGFVVEGLLQGADGFSGNFTIALPHYSK